MIYKMTFLGITTYLAITPLVAFSETQQDEYQPLYKFEVAVPNEVTGAGANKNLEVYRQADGTIADLSVISPASDNTARKSCGCIWISETECIQIPCGGGTFEVENRIFFSIVDSGKDANSEKSAIKALNLSTGKTTTITLPEFKVDPTGRATIVEED